LLVLWARAGGTFMRASFRLNIASLIGIAWYRVFR